MNLRATVKLNHLARLLAQETLVNTTKTYTAPKYKSIFVSLTILPSIICLLYFKGILFFKETKKTQNCTCLTH